MDLSFPKGDAINDYIDPDDCTIKFDSFDGAVGMVAKLGKGEAGHQKCIPYLPSLQRGLRFVRHNVGGSYLH